MSDDLPDFEDVSQGNEIKWYRLYRASAMAKAVEHMMSAYPQVVEVRAIPSHNPNPEFILLMGIDATDASL